MFALFALCGIFQIPAMGQISPPPGPHHRTPKEGYDRDCVHRNIYTETHRSHFFPFNVADSVKLVSFRYHNNSYPIKKGYIINDSLIEQRLLTKSEVNQLTDIIYNTGVKKNNGIASLTECFWPRNAVLFIDKSGQLRAYVLICFHCNRSENSNDGMRPWDDCYQKSEMIHQLFISAGIKYGTDLTISNYPGECDDCLN